MNYKRLKLLTDSGFYDYCGALHIHSKHSDGTGTVKDIIESAKSCDLDYIIITDHNNLNVLETAPEGWYDDLLVLVGEEIGKPGKSHYLAFDIKSPIIPDDNKNMGFYIQAVKNQGGFGFVAHPIGVNRRIFGLHLSSWDAWDNPDYDGLEIWSYMRDWVGNINLFNLLYYYLRPEGAVRGPNPEVLEKWDQLCKMRKVVGVGGVDVHARHIFPFNFMKFLSYKKAFCGLRTHLITKVTLPPNLNESKKIVYNSLRAGNCFFAHDSLKDSRGFTFLGHSKDAGIILMGDEVKTNSEVELEIKSPAKANLNLLRNGQLIDKALDSKKLICKVKENGVYRVEAYLNKKPWVFTNPIYLR